MQKYKAIKVEHQWQIIEGDTLIAIAGCDNSAIPSFDVPEEWEEEVEILADKYSHTIEDEYISKHNLLIYTFEGFKSGYNAAKEKYKWTDEDMEKIYNKGVIDGEDIFVGFFEDRLEEIKQPKEYEVDIEFVNNKVIIKSWKNVN